MPVQGEGGMIACTPKTYEVCSSSCGMSSKSVVKRVTSSRPLVGRES